MGMNSTQSRADSMKNYYPESPDKDIESMELQIQIQRKDEKIEELYH